MAALLSPKSRLKVIMLPNEVFARACRAYYEEQGLIVDETNGQFAHCPYPRGMGETGYYLLWEHHQHQGLLQSKDVGRCCFFVGHARKWLSTCDYWPDNYFELWDIYEEFATGVGEMGKETLSRVKHLANSPEAIAKMIATRKAKGITTRHLQEKKVRARAAKTMREFWMTEEGMEKRRIIRNRRAPRARTIEVEFPNGRVGVYSCVKLASLALGVTPSTISRWIKGSNSPQGRLKGLKVRETAPPTA